MWHWQRKSVRKQYVLWVKLFFISVVGHIGMLLVFCFLYHEPTRAIAIEVNNVASPLQSSNRGVLVVNDNRARRTGTVNKTLVSATKNGVQAKAGVVSKKIAVQKPKQKVVSKKSEPKKDSDKNAFVAQVEHKTKIDKNVKPDTKAKSVSIKNASVKPADSKVVKNTPKKVVQKKEKPKQSTESLKPAAVKQAALKPVEQKIVKPEVSTAPMLKDKPQDKSVVEKKSVAEKKSDSPVSVKKEEKEVVAVKSVVTNTVVGKSVEPVDKEDDKLIAFSLDKSVQDNQKDSVDGQSVQDVYSAHSIKMAQRCEQLRQELVSNWQPPMGITLSKGCRVLIAVDQLGKTGSIAIEESSGVLMFDISVQSVCQGKQWPQWAYNKSLVITFNE